ncbi:MAG: hypothetical protein WBZ33_05445 [Thermoactinomyces sp.]|jgi:hypothetical protein
MAYQVETRGLEEHQHPFYVIRYAVMKDGNDLLTSVARYIQTKDGSRVQFLEPDMKKLQRLPDGMKYIDEVERVVKEEGARLVEELRKK